LAGCLLAAERVKKDFRFDSRGLPEALGLAGKARGRQDEARISEVA